MEYDAKMLMLIDGSSMLSTSFFGNAPMTYLRAKTDEQRDAALSKMLKTSEGRYTNAVFTMVRVLLKIINDHKPTHMAVAWDISRETFRKEMYPQYKAHRPETRPELSEQFETMQGLLDAMNICQLKVDGYEADDIIGTLASRHEKDVPVIVVTKDQDALQLVSGRTRVWLQTSKAPAYRELCGTQDLTYACPQGFFEFTPVTFENVYGLKPYQMVDKKALEGDSSDNIPGVKGVGSASVVPLLQEFGTVEQLYAQIEGLSPEEEAELKEIFSSAGIRRSPLAYLLKESATETVGKQAALLSKELATICRDVSGIDGALDDLVLSVNRAGMIAAFKELEFKTMLRDLETTTA